MSESEWLTTGFERNRTRLRAVAYRMLGSVAEADDAVQEAWLRLNRSDVSDVDNLGAWLTTVVARVCLNMLRARNTRREDFVGAHIPDPVVSRLNAADPEDETVLADSVGLALQVVINTLSPPERLAFVLHDLFGLPFEEIGPMVGRSTVAARQLASRARRRVRGAELRASERDLSRQREVVDAFFAAAHRGDFDALVAVLDPNVVLRSDAGPARSRASAVVHGPLAVAGRAISFARRGTVMWPVLVNGAAGVVLTLDRHPVSLMGFNVSDGRIVEIDVISDPERLARLDLGVFS